MLSVAPPTLRDRTTARRLETQRSDGDPSYATDRTLIFDTLPDNDAGTIPALARPNLKFKAP